MKSFFVILFKYYDTVESRWALYVTSSFLISLYDGLKQYGDIDLIPWTGWFMILLFSFIQALVTWRAFIDQSLARSKVDASEVSNVKIPEPTPKA